MGGNFDEFDELSGIRQNFTRQNLTLDNWVKQFVKIVPIKICSYSICQNFPPSNFHAVQYYTDQRQVHMIYSYVVEGQIF